MKKIINVEKALLGTPKPHYLIGDATYEVRDGRHTITGKVNFKSEGNLSIGSRTEKYVKHPHVNSGDALFAMWNAAHLIGDQLGYTTRTLANEIRILIPSRGIIPPDTPLDLWFELTDGGEREDHKGIQYCLGQINGRLSLDGRLLTEVSSNYFARK